MKSLKLKKTKSLESVPGRVEFPEFTEDSIEKIKRYVRSLETESGEDGDKASAVANYEWHDSFPKKWYRVRRKSTVCQSVLFEIGCQRYNQAVIERQVARNTKDPLKSAR